MDVARATAAALERLGEIQREVRAARGDPSRWPFRQAAAVLSQFVPEELRSFDTEGGPSTRGWPDFMLDCEPASGRGGGWWRLREGLRREGLRRLGTRERIQAALKANAPRPDDYVQRVFEQILAGGGRDLKLRHLPVEQLAAMVVVRDWLSGIVADVPSEAALREALVCADLLTPMRRLAGDNRFVGRGHELAELREYVGVMASDSLPDRARRFALDRYYSDVKLRPPLLIAGPGGVGKSALLARFILDHSGDMDSPDTLPFVYLDIDHAAIDPANPISLIVAAALQLAVEWPHLEGRLRSIADYLTKLVGATESLFEVSRNVSPLTSAMFDFGSVLRDGSQGRPVLFVIDTFEEAQVLGFDVVGELGNLLGALQSAAPMIRIVMAGRGDLKEQTSVLPTKLITLGDLSPEEARELVRRHVLPQQALDSGLVNEIVEFVGRNPMSLKLASSIVCEQSLEALQTVETRGRLFLRIKAETVQARLYGRILAHLHDDDARKLAKPGLVVRRLTADVIREILAGPCGIPIDSPSRADELMAHLESELWLVERAGDGSLRHRQDVRRIMLKDLEEDVSPDTIREIHDRAVRYYEAQAAGPVARAEEIYHRLMRGDDPATVGARWVDGVDAQLRTAIEEVPVTARIWLSHRLGITPDRALLKRAELEEWENITEQAVQRLLRAGSPTQALEALKKRSERSPGSPLFRFESEALRLLGRYQAARGVAERGLAATGQAGVTPAYRDLLIQLAHVEEADGQLEAALEALRRALAVPGDRVAPIEALHIAVIQTRLLRKLGKKRESECTVAIERASALLTSDVGDGLIQQPGLLREVVAELGTVRSDLLNQGLEALGLLPLTTEQRDLLARAFAGWDKRLGTHKGRRGELAERAGLPLTAGEKEWRQFLVQEPPTSLAHRIVNWRAELRPDHEVDNAIVGIYRSSVEAALAPQEIFYPR
jgi:tetratricopeptide (TPR) repeat protein